MSARDELARAIFLADNSGAPAGLMEAEWDQGMHGPDSYAHNIADGLLAAGYVKADHVEYALDHKLSDLQFTDDDGELWTDEEDVKDYAAEYGDTAPLVQRQVTAWAPLS